MTRTSTAVLGIDKVLAGRNGTSTGDKVVPAVHDIENITKRREYEFMMESRGQSVAICGTPTSPRVVGSVGEILP